MVLPAVISRRRRFLIASIVQRIVTASYANRRLERTRRMLTAGHVGASGDRTSLLVA